MHKARPLLACSTLLVLTCLCPAQEQRPEAADEPDLRAILTTMPPPPQRPPVPVEAWSPDRLLEFADGMRVLDSSALVLRGTVLFAEGPTDGLEVIACLRGGKNHESLMVLHSGNATAVKAGMLAYVGVTGDGAPVGEASGQLPRGTPVRLRLRWCPDPLLEPDSLVEADVSTLVRNRIIDNGYPPLPYIYIGSRMERMPVTTPEGERRTITRFMLDVTKSVVVNFNEPDALIAAPYPMAMWDHVFEVNTGNNPPFEDVEADLIISRAELPVSLRMGPAGELYDADDVLVDDARLAQLLRSHFLAPEPDALHAIGVHTDPSLPRALDHQVEQRVLRLAARERVWAIPVFVQAAE
ncbi:MAG: hypothetical protein ACOCXA_03580 [Planctomycetota bacterium]